METLALILAGGRGSRLDILSEKRVKPGVPFAGKFRIIDFTLSNCVNSNIYNIGIMTQYLPLSLNEHIGVGKPWDLDRRDSAVTLLQPHSEWYLGTADAVKKNIEFIIRNNPKYCLILSGDHIYKMNYDLLIKEHEKNNADLTIACKVVPKEEASRFGILEADKDNKIIDFEEKPEKPKSDLASMGIYVFNTDVLIKSIMSMDIIQLDFGKHIIPELINTHKVYAYKFYDYWKDVGTLESYLDANLELIGSNNETPDLDMYDSNWKIYTRSEDLPSVKLGETAKVNKALVSNGSIILGEVYNSVLSPGVIIHEGATVKDSVILNDVVINTGSVIENSIIDKDTIIGKNCKIGFGDNYELNNEAPHLLTKGINVIGKKVIIPDNTLIERNVRIFGKSDLNDEKSLQIKSGETIRPKNKSLY